MIEVRHMTQFVYDDIIYDFWWFGDEHIIEGKFALRVTRAPFFYAFLYCDLARFYFKMRQIMCHAIFYESFALLEEERMECRIQ